MNIIFLEKFKNLIVEDVPRIMIDAIAKPNDRETENNLKNGFVELYFEDYGEHNNET